MGKKPPVNQEDAYFRSFSVPGHESFHHDQFFRYANSGRADLLFKESVFLREFELPYDASQLDFPKDPLMPYYQADFIELDRYGRFHLWEIKKLLDPQAQSWRVVGQVLLYDWIFSNYPTEEEVNCGVLSWRAAQNVKRHYADDDAAATRVYAALMLTHLSRPRFSTINIVLVGGEGWECAALVNPIMHEMPMMCRSKIKGSPINLWHMFYLEGGDVEMKAVERTSLFYPQSLHPQALDTWCRRNGHVTAEFCARAVADPDYDQEHANWLTSDQDFLDHIGRMTADLPLSTEEIQDRVLSNPRTRALFASLSASTTSPSR